MVDTHLPMFQRQQQDFTQCIRKGQKESFPAQKSPGLVKNSPEKQHIQTYQERFFNKHFRLFSDVFPILTARLGVERSQEWVRAFLQNHAAQTPLFHELGQEFLRFMQSDAVLALKNPDYFLELAHYEWATMAVSIEPQEGPLNEEDALLDWQAVYQLSPVAWPLAYEWPVHEMDATNVVEKPDWPTFLLVFRDDEDAVQKIILSPVLYELLLSFMDNQTQTAEQVLTQLAAQMQQPLADLQGFVEPLLQQFIEQNLLAIPPSNPKESV